MDHLYGYGSYSEPKGGGAISTHKACHHDGMVPVLIGGFPIHLTSSFHVKATVLENADLILPLNGSIPRDAPFGYFLPIIQCELSDRGGVPGNWKEFIEVVAKYMREGRKVVAWCTGSHGRTGTLGASLISYMEPETEDPIAAIRERHCKDAVESLAQAKAIYDLRGLELPEKYGTEFKPIVYKSIANSIGWTPGKLYYHDKGCPCTMCLADGGGTNKGRYTPCQCTRYRMCEDDRKEYENRHKQPGQGLAIVKVTGNTATTKSEEAAHGLYCFCAKCVARDSDNEPHDARLDMNCSCKFCTVRWKLDNRPADFSVFEGHPRGCMCEKCWWVMDGHGPNELGQPCVCAECIYLNTGATELDNMVDWAPKKGAPPEEAQHAHAAPVDPKV